MFGGRKSGGRTLSTIRVPSMSMNEAQSLLTQTLRQLPPAPANLPACSQEGTGTSAKSKFSFAFRCHRDGALIYPINAIDTHPDPAHGAAFVTGGGDGMYTIWDKDKRTRYREVKAAPASPITSMLWNPTGDLLAYSKGYDWSKGAEGYDPTNAPPKLFVHHTTPPADLTLKT